MRDRHAEHCLALARRADAGFRGGERGLWRARLRLERDNFRLALAWTRARRMDLGLRLAALLARFWTQEGWVREGRSWLESMLAEGTDDPDLLATATGRAGDLAYLDADYAAARSWLEQSLALKREFDDQLGVARRLGRLSAVAMAAGEGGAAEGLAGEALEIHRRLGDPRGIAWANLFLGWAAQVACDGRLAADSFEQALTMHRSLGETDGIAYDLMGLTGVALEAGDVASARHRFAEAAPLIVGPLHGVPADPGWLWAGLVLAEAEGRDRAALRLAGAADARARAGVRWNEALRVRYQPVVDRARLRAGAAEAGRLITEGAEMSVEELVAVALERVG
jgi:hypothetical protein